jgi:hypothetical protein
VSGRRKKMKSIGGEMEKGTGNVPEGGGKEGGECSGYGREIARSVGQVAQNKVIPLQQQQRA